MPRVVRRRGIEIDIRIRFFSPLTIVQSAPTCRPSPSAPPLPRSRDIRAGASRVDLRAINTLPDPGSSPCGQFARTTSSHARAVAVGPSSNSIRITSSLRLRAGPLSAPIAATTAE